MSYTDCMVMQAALLSSFLAKPCLHIEKEICLLLLYFCFVFFNIMMCNDSHLKRGLNLTSVEYVR